MYTMVPGAVKLTPLEWNTVVEAITWKTQHTYMVAEGGQLKGLRGNGESVAPLPLFAPSKAISAPACRPHACTSGCYRW